ncbi:MAG: hypothetical protein J6U58_06635 [Bacteroidaceae bacterium]|nr:hypothetical protein [Bacteroidaceae bacterium]
MQKRYFKIAEHTFSIESNENDILTFLPNMQPFVTEESESPLFEITIDNSIIPSWQGVKVGKFPCPSATFEVYRQESGEYYILVSDENEIPCSFIISDSQLQKFKITTRGENEKVIFGLNNSLMVIYTMCTAPHSTLLIHSSVVEHNGKAYMFLGESGRGKSTHSDLWVKHIEGSRLINDDNPVIRIDNDGTPTVYGSPWSGKRPIYMNVHYPIGGMTAIEQAKDNKIRKESIPVAFGILLSSCSTLKFDKRIHMHICNSISSILESLPIYTLFCLPDKEAAMTSSSTFGA